MIMTEKASHYTNKQIIHIFTAINLANVLERDLIWN